MAWMLTGAGAAVAVACLALGLIFRHHFRRDVDDVVTELGTLRYGAENEQE